MARVVLDEILAALLIVALIFHLWRKRNDRNNGRWRLAA
jgi:hypothetical protein